VTGGAVPGEAPGTVHVRTSLGPIACQATGDLVAGRPVVIALRPEHIGLAPAGDGTENAIDGLLESAHFIGNAMDCTVRCGSQRLRVLLHPERTPVVGAAMTLYAPVRHCLAMSAP
ncbi:MAG: hypothetical protein RL477_167, partial [Pseudomonadota bacterium]|jgi:ABC-type sugar transport system ATPase subunit